MSKQSKTLIKLIVLGVLTVFATIPVIAFGWFSNNNGISASGTGVTVKSLGLEIRSERNGADISVLEPSEEMKYIKNMIYDDEDKIRPSSSGYFEFYVHNANEDEYGFVFNAAVKNNEFSVGEGFKTPSDAASREKALKYINSHIMMFTEYKDGVYSGYIPTDGSVKRKVTKDNDGGHVVVYWIWIAYYDEIFTDKKNIIEESARKEIADYYSKEENRAKMFEGDEADENGYNQADCVIGTTIQHICFALNVWED